jgi:hypothetical protein
MPPPDALDDPVSIWIPIFTFGREDARSDGTMVVIHSGSPDGAPPAPFRTLDRFRAATGNPGDLQLIGDVVDLRLRAADGSVIHARRFISPGRYVRQSFRLLRKADGTAFFILPTGDLAASFPAGGFRIDATFRRDNRAADAASIVLSEARQTTDENVTLDVPWTVTIH